MIKFMRKLSIIIPAYNCEIYLEQCIKSIYKQLNGEDIEVIIVNDCSTDNTILVAKKYEGHPNLKIINLKYNLGVSNARNIGMDNAEGKYLFFLDADDMLIPGSIKKMLDYIDNKNYDIVKFNFKKYLKNFPYTTYKMHNKGEFSIKEGYNDIIFQNFLNYYDLYSSWGQLLLSEVAKKNKFDTDLILAEDMAFNLNMYFNIENMYIDNTPAIYYRYNNKSVTHYADNKRIIAKAVSCYKGYSELYKYDKYQKYTEQIDERIIDTTVSIFCDIYHQDINQFNKLYNEFLFEIKKLKRIDRIFDIEFIKNKCRVKSKKKLRNFIKMIIN